MLRMARGAGAFVEVTAERRAAGPSRARARGAVSLCFFVNGIVFASWVPHIPDLKTRLEISDGGLGLVLLSTAVGAVLALPAAGSLLRAARAPPLTAPRPPGPPPAAAVPLLPPT